jgi:Phasin protein
MNLAGQIASVAARLMQFRAGPYAERALRLARHGAERAAERVEAAGPPIATLAEAGLKLTEIGFRSLDQLVRRGIESAQATLTDGAERLRMSAKARTLSALYAAQRVALPQARRRVAGDLEATWQIVSSASADVVELARSTRSELARASSRRTRRAVTSRSRARKRTSRRRASERHPTT